jgi:hypothetical protein
LALGQFTAHEDAASFPSAQFPVQFSKHPVCEQDSLLGQMESYSGIEYYDPGYSSFKRSGSRLPARPGSSGLTNSSNAGMLSYVFPVAPNNVGLPDPDVVEYLPPSAKQVFQVLASDGPLAQKDIITRTDLPPRTVRYAQGRLKDEEMLEERFCFSDARQSLYSLNGMEAR